MPCTMDKKLSGRAASISAVSFEMSPSLYKRSKSWSNVPMPSLWPRAMTVFISEIFPSLISWRI